MTSPNININTFHSSKWKLTFSNIPTVTKLRDLSLYELFVKDLTLPGISLDLVNINFKGSQTFQPISRENAELPTLSINFKVDENLENFYNLHLYMLTMRYGQNVSTELLKDNIVKDINVSLLDNQKNVTKIFKFSNAALIDLSPLTLGMGNDSEITFSTTWRYQEVNVG